MFYHIVHLRPLANGRNVWIDVIKKPLYNQKG